VNFHLYFPYSLTNLGDTWCRKSPLNTVECFVSFFNGYNEICILNSGINEIVYTGCGRKNSPI